MSKQTKKIKLAVFDIDGTIFRSSLTVELVNGFFAAGIFPKRAKKEMETDYLAWMDRKGHYDTFTNKLIEILFRYLPGKKKQDVDRAVVEVLSWQKNRVYRYTRDLIKDLRHKKYYLIAISGSPSYMVQKFAFAMGFRIAYGLPYEIKDEKFTGQILNMGPVEHKETVLKSIIEKYQLDPDYEQSIAVGDTHIDIPMLEMVGQPVAFNPNRELAEYAQKRKWKIVVERKDVIYNIKNFVFEV